MRAFIVAVIIAAAVGSGLFTASSYVVAPGSQGIFGSNHQSVQAWSFENKDKKNRKRVVHRIGW